MDVNQKYLKDENGNVISPIVGIDCVYFDDGETLTEYLTDYQKTISNELSGLIDNYVAGVYLPLTAGSSNPLTGSLYTSSVYPRTDKGYNIGSTSRRYYTVHTACIELYDTAPYIDFHFNNSSSDYTGRIIETESGVLAAYNSISSASDKRLKNNIEDIDDKYINLFDKLEVKTYNFNNSDVLDCGLIAQDVLESESELEIEDSILIRGTGEEIEVERNGETKTEVNYYSLNYNNLVAMCVKKIQELEKRIEELENN